MVPKKFVSQEEITRLFGRVWGASGVQGFFGRGYRFHRYLGPFKPDFTGITFVAKTTTLYPREGNTPLQGSKEHYEPQAFLPKSVSVGLRGFIRGYALNAWGLSGPGVAALLQEGRWQERTDPFMVSFMTVAERPEDQILELTDFTEVMKRHAANFKSTVGIQLNLSCPNTERDTKTFLSMAVKFLDIITDADYPVIVKVSVDMPPIAVTEIAAHPGCAGLCVTNTVKFGKLPEEIPWGSLFGSTSPLANMGGGGLSGAPLLPLTAKYLTRLRALGVNKHVNAGGGILRPKDSDILMDAGADSVFIGSMAMLRPWRVRKTINHVTQNYP